MSGVTNNESSSNPGGRPPTALCHPWWVPPAADRITEASASVCCLFSSHLDGHCCEFKLRGVSPRIQVL